MSLESRLAALVAAIGADIKALRTQASIPIEGWHTIGAAGEPAYSSPWGYYGGDTLGQFRKLPSGEVQLRGTLQSSATFSFNSSSGTLFTLPVGYRPTEYFDTLVWAYTPGQGQGSVRVRVNTNGVVVLIASQSGNLASTSGFLLGIEDIHFPSNQTTFPTGPQGPIGPAGPPTASEAWRTVGAAGQPAFENGWTHLVASTIVQFRKTPTGHVELRGRAKDGNLGVGNGAVFTLPSGYRPQTDAGRFLDVAVATDGRVVAYAQNTDLVLDWHTFSTD